MNLKLDHAAFVGIPVLVFIGAVAVRSQQDHAANQRDATAQQHAVLRKHGLAAAAAVTGSFRTRHEYRYVGGPVSIAELAKLSHLVVVGTVTTNACVLTADSRSIVTLYDVKVESMLSGTGQKPERVTVALPGGKVIFPDQSWAEVMPSGIFMPTIDQRLVFFLRRAHSNVTVGNESHIRGGAFVPTSGPLGVYPLTMTGRRFVQPAGYPTSELARSIFTQKLGADGFIGLVKTTISPTTR